jgi:membrane fusion protein, multidrug efflux system
VSISGKRKALFLLPALALGVVVFIFLVKSRTPPEQADFAERVRAVRVIEAREIAFRPRAVGYGMVEPSIQWEAIAEVGGRIVEMHPELRPGSIIPQGETLFRIDPVTYGLAESIDQADLDNLAAQVRELEQRENNYRRILETEKRSLRIAEEELERRRQLVAKGTISKSEVDKEEQGYLAQKQAVQNLHNSLDLLPAQREALEAKLESGLHKLQDTRLDVGRTVITAPFDLRVDELDVELSQYASAGKTLLKAYDIAVAEVPAQMPLSAMRNVIGPHKELDISSLGQFTMEIIRELLGLEAVVRLPFGDESVEWKARFARMGEKIDPQTRTIPVYVAVDDPYRKAHPGKRPPLVKNMYVQVELLGKPGEPRIVLPRAAIRQGDAGPVVYVVDPESRLEIRSVVILQRQDGLAVIREGIARGERVIVSDIAPAIAGQLLETQRDEALEQHILAQAGGEAPLQ